MVKNFQKIILLNFIILNLFLAVQSVSAEEKKVWVIPQPRIAIPGMETLTEPTNCPTDSSGNKQCSTTWIAQYVSSIYKYAVAVVGILAVVVMMFGGARWIVSGGNASAITDAKAWIASSLTGLILILTSYIILYTVNPGLVSYKAMSLQEVEKGKEMEEEYIAESANVVLTESTNTTVKDFTNIKFSSKAASDVSKLNPKVINLLKTLDGAGIKVNVSCAITGHSIKTITGNVSRHTTGLAVDLTGTREELTKAVEYLSKYQKSSVGELIYSYEPQSSIKDGKGYTLTNAKLTKAHYNHIHLAGKK